MTAPSVIQTSFHTGEWAPALNARVDLQKYHSAAALLKNFFVDYRGGASTRTGTKYILQCYKSSTAIRLIPFQASFTVNYVLEFGDQYIRFYTNGAAVLETAIAITGATQANPCVLSVANAWAVSDWVYVAGVGGMTQLNGRYFNVTARTGGTITISDLNGTAINSTAYGAYTAGGTAARVYTLAAPYAAADLALLKYAQNVNTLVITHPSYVPYVLTLVSATSWTIAPIAFGATIGVPTGQSAATTLGAGSANYAYVVTSVDVNGQESGPSGFATLANKLDLRTTAGTNTISWTAVTGAHSYNVYESQLSYAGAVPAGAQFGFIGNCTSNSFIDSNIAPDYSITPPIPKNPFQGAGVASVVVTVAGAYTTVPSVTFGAAPSGGSTAIGLTVMQAVSATIAAAGTGYVVGNTITYPGNVVFTVTSIGGFTGNVTGISLTSPGNLTGSSTNPVSQISTSGSGTGCTLNITWKVAAVSIVNPGTGYTSAPAVTFSSGAAAATATLEAQSAGNPGVPTYFQQRLVLAGPTNNPQLFNMSRPGAYYNFDVSDPIQADDAISDTLASGQLNTIKSMISMSAGLVVLSDRQAWLINGGSAGSAVTPIDVTANSQAYNGASDVPPIVANFDILYVQAKGSNVRDLTFNFYTNIYTGTDISVLSSHLFYGYHITEWAWAEEPFKIAWTVRNDGTMLTLTFLKEQELIGWCHSVTDGLFKSVTAITESVSFGTVDAVYTVVQRTIGVFTVQYVERFAERIFVNGVTDAWCVDAGLQYNGAPATSFTGGEHLAGKTVTGLADGIIITPFVMNAAGTFTLGTAASKVTVGIAFTCDLQTLALDINGGETVQGKEKKIPSVVVRVADTLGLSIGSTFSDLVAMKDLVRGNVGSMTNAVVTDLVTGDARTMLDPKYSTPGQYCIRQSNPYPASILGVIPQIVVGDTK